MNTLSIYDTFQYPKPSTGPELIPDVCNGLAMMLRHEGLPGWRVLDAGCGTGHRLVALAQQHPEAQFVGLDLSAPSLEVARELAAEHGVTNVEFVHGDVRTPVNGVFDLIVCSGVLHHLPDPAAGLRALCGALAPDGLLYLWLYHALGEADRMWDRELVHLFSRDLPNGPDIGTVRALGLSLSPHRYGPASWDGALTDQARDVLHADAYLNPTVRPFRFGELPALFDGTALDWVAVVGVNGEGRGHLLDLSGTADSPFHLSPRETFDPSLVGRMADWDNLSRATAVELAVRPTGFTLLAGRGEAAAECEPWVRGDVIIGDPNPPGPPLPQADRDRRRRRMVREQLGPALAEAARSLRAAHGEAAVTRISEAVDVARGLRPRRGDALQRPALFHVPDLPARPWVEPADYPELAAFVGQLERDWRAIRDELDTLAARDGGLVDVLSGAYMTEKFAPRVASDWTNLPVYGDGGIEPAVAAHCPRLAGALREHAALLSGYVIMSRLRPGAAIPAHVDDNNYKLTIHLGLRVPEGCGIRVGAERRQWETGRCLVFSDAYDHEVWNPSDEPRDVLLIDVWHPLLSAGERRSLRQVREILAPACEPTVFDSF